MEEVETKRQKSESVGMGILLCVVGGFLDAYSFLCRGQVFANAQTGNLVLLAVYLAAKDYATASQYLYPIIAFIFGIGIADFEQHRFKQNILHWRQTSVLIEIVLIFVVAFLPTSWNYFANVLISLACGIQVESFQKFGGHKVLTTVLVGNLRTATQALSQWVFHKDKKQLGKSIFYYSFILLFGCGAILGYFCIQLISNLAVIVCGVLLMICFLLMFDWEKEEERHHHA